MLRARLIAFYLPQFQPTPENDEWWGKGFTEWTNVTRAKPLFQGHYQPRLPADLGFYDLRVPETRAAQADLARQYGIEGFCYWHYWFHGRRILERTVNDVVASGQPDFPFSLAWANHNWSRSWLGDQSQILLEQTYSPEDDLAHARYLASVFADSRYIRVNGRPLFSIYSPTEMPDPQRTTDTIRAECVRLGLPEPFLLGMNSRAVATDARSIGFDSTIHILPQSGALPPRLYNGDWGTKTRLLHLLKLRGTTRPLDIRDYETAVNQMLAKRPPYPHLPCIFVGFDNTARRGKESLIYENATPESFERLLRRIIAETEAAYQPEERLVFVNAWNEWAEGMYLEPDQRHGHGFLEAVRKVNTTEASNPADQLPIPAAGR